MVTTRRDVDVDMCFGIGDASVVVIVKSSQVEWQSLHRHIRSRALGGGRGQDARGNVDQGIGRGVMKPLNLT